jgi:peptidoglycan/LPS O-acetylase OafA/YrhL
MRTSNNFGALRLLFAVLVILSHSSELLDGNRSREILTGIFDTLSFGELAVLGFFLISGYLVTKSLQNSRSTGDYLTKRVLRIYPGYVVAFLLCMFALGPFVGGEIETLSGVRVAERIVLLHTPKLQGVFADTPYPALNGSMWSIAVEFQCYLILAALGVIGLLSRRFSLSLVIAGLLALSAARFSGTLLKFFAVFGCGALFYLYRDRIYYNWRLAIVAACGLIVLMFSSRLAVAAFAILGGYLLFWFAFNVKSPALARVGRNVDISYGVYLYAWPVQKSLIWANPGISPWVLFIEATTIASIIAWGSWWLVEKPFLDLKTRLTPAVSDLDVPRQSS